MDRIIAIVLCLALLAMARTAPAKPSSFEILGASVHVEVARNGVQLPAAMVPSLKAGDTVEISFPKGVQFSHSPRWHLVAADMYDDYIQHAPTFPIPDADLNAAPAGHVWSVRAQQGAMPIFFLVPEDGTRRGHGIPAARAAISDLRNRALLLKTASLSADAEAKKSAMQSFMKSLAAANPQSLDGGRARIAAASQSMFGYSLGDQACFAAGVPESTQDACVAHAMAAGYTTSPSINVAAAASSQLSVNSATYGMLVGAIYQLMMQRRVEAHYRFIPGALRPGSDSNAIYVNEQPSYDPSAAKPSSIVYFEVGARGAGSSNPAYKDVPTLPVCVSAPWLSVNALFEGSPSYLRAQQFLIDSGTSHFSVEAKYNPISGYSAQLSLAQYAAISNGATARIVSLWGFDRYESAAAPLVRTRPVSWQMQDPAAPITSGGNAETLTFTDGGAGMARCVQSVEVTDGIGQPIPVTHLERTKDAVIATIDATKAAGASASATLTQYGAITSAPLTIAMLPALPQITSAIAYLPKGVLVLHGTGLKYINTLDLKQTGIVFSNGTPNADGSWSFTASAPTRINPRGRTRR